jgi:hypothetical protein
MSRAEQSVITIEPRLLQFFYQSLRESSSQNGDNGLEMRPVIQNVQMKGIQNKIIVSQKAFITHIYKQHHYKGKL